MLQKLHKMLAYINIATISPRTVRNRLKEVGIHDRAPFSKPLLTKKHIKARLEFELNHQNWTVEDGKHLLFTNESKLNG